ncbi:MAG: hypothetical protein JWQ96_1182 [Segetibacter sp.]|nr:hypothetical protein [Segetibacter sp.]
MIFFAVLQLFINFKRGMVVSPFYHYGMYSEVIRVKASYEVFEIWVNGERLQGKDFSAQQWDQVILPVQYFAALNTKSNPLYFNEIKRLMAKIGLKADEEKYVATCNYNQFQWWYKQYLNHIVKRDVAGVKILSRGYIFQQTLKPTSTYTDLSALCQ